MTSKETIERNKKYCTGNGKFFQAYHGMVNRCTKENATGYIYWGGRGIKCEWASFEDFRLDMFDKFITHLEKHGKRNTTLDRINTDGNYNKENCRWATYKEQNKNRRAVRLMEFKGEVKTIWDWAESVNMRPFTLYNRLNNLGWDFKDAISRRKYGRK